MFDMKKRNKKEDNILIYVSENITNTERLGKEISNDLYPQEIFIKFKEF